jgi:hypothetical protein
MEGVEIVEIALDFGRDDGYMIPTLSGGCPMAKVSHGYLYGFEKDS